MIEIDTANERIVKVVRKHWFVLVVDVLLLIVLVAVPMVCLFALHLIPIEKIINFHGSPGDAAGFFFFAWLIIVWMIGWGIWTNYYLDVLIITDKRIFTVEQTGLFRRKSGSFRIDRIQNVTGEVSGIIQTLLDFGTLRLETAGEHEDFVAPYIGKPYEVKKFISQMQDQLVDQSQPTSMNKQPI